MLLNITLVGDTQLLARLDSMPQAVAAQLRGDIKVMAEVLASYVITKKLHGQVLHQRSGQLARSIQSREEQDGLTVRGFVYSAGDVKYAGIHEFGGTIHHPGGTPYFPGAGINGGALFYSNAAADALAGTGHPILRTAAHDIPMPERSFLRSSLRDNEETIERGLLESYYRAVTAQMGGTA